jgi:hypothetical protein
MSANKTCLPALTRRIIAWPMDPAPITTITFVIQGLRCPIVIQFHVENRIGRGIQQAPKLALVRPDLKLGRREHGIGNRDVVYR